MSSSESDDTYSTRRKKQLHSKKKPVVQSSDSEDSEYSEYSESEQSSSDNSQDSYNTDDDQDDKNMSKMVEKEEKEKKQSAGFCLPGADEEPKIFVLCGSCASGKSHMLKYCFSIYGARKQFKFGLCFTSTKFTGDYDYLPEKSVREFDMDYLENYIKHLREKIVAGKNQHGSKWNLPANFVVIDDSIGLVQNSGFFANFIATHRHTKTTIFMLTQQLTAAKSVSTVLRANTSYALIWPSAMQNVLDGLWKSYGQFYKFVDFKKELDECRKRKYSCLVFKNSPDHTTAEESYTRIKAPADIPDFELRF